MRAACRGDTKRRVQIIDSMTASAELLALSSGAQGGDLCLRTKSMHQNVKKLFLQKNLEYFHPELPPSLSKGGASGQEAGLEVSVLSSTGSKSSSVLNLDSRLVFSAGLINVARRHSELAEPGQHLFWLGDSLSRHGNRNRNVNDKNIKVIGLCLTMRIQ